MGLVSVAPSGLIRCCIITHGWRRGLHSCAASRLASREAPGTATRHSHNTVRFRTIPHYERDLVRCRRQQVAFFIMAEKSKLEWWFTGSILLLAISILGFAYLFWESYLVTKR